MALGVRERDGGGQNEHQDRDQRRSHAICNECDRENLRLLTTRQRDDHRPPAVEPAAGLIWL